MRRVIAVILLSTLLLSGCNGGSTASGAGLSSAASQPTPIPPPAPGEGLSALVGQIMRHPERYEGQQVVVVGYFRGQDLLDGVSAAPPRDRIQDWVIEDDSGAIYVADQGLLPFPSTSHEIWRVVRVSGEVQRMDRTGIPYILPKSVEWEGLKGETEMLPAFCRLAIHRSGGPDQLDHHIYWYTTGNLVVHDAKRDWRGVVQLSRGDRLEWETALNRARFFDLQSTEEPTCDAQVRYTFAAVHERRNEPHFVTLCEDGLPARLEALVTQMIDKAGEAQPIE